MKSTADYVRLELAGTTVDCALRFSETKKYIRRFISAEPAEADKAIGVSETAFQDWEKVGNGIDAFAEFCLLCQPCSEALMEMDRCVFHAFALRYRERAFLIAGGSGAGKSTHGSLLIEKYPEECSAINGDKPVLELVDDGVVVHPSPWNGKEGQHGAPATRLAGIFYLRRTDENAVKRLDGREAAICTFPMVFQSFENETVIHKAGAFTERILQRIPVFLFSSRDIEESSAMLYQAIKEAASDDV